MVRKLASKLLLTGMATSAIIGGLTACGTSNGNGTSNGSGASSAKSSSPQVITFASWTPWSQHPDDVKILKKINAANKGKFVLKPVYIPSAGYEQKLLTELAAGDAPDIFYLNYGDVNAFAKNNTLLDLNSYMQADKGKYLSADVNNYFPNSLTADSVKGQYYALPYIDQPDVIYYNPALFKAAHLPLPTENWTWQTFLKDAKALSDPSKNQYGYLQSPGWPPLETYIWSYGGDMFNKGMTKSLLTSPADIKGIELMQTMVKDKIIPPQSAIQNLSIEDLFRQGKVAMFMGGSDDGNYTYNNKPINTAIAPVPRGTTQATDSYIAEIAANAKAKNPALVTQAFFALVQGMSDDQIVPPIKQYADTMEQISIPSAPNGHLPKDRLPVIKDSMKFARPIQPFPDMTQYSSILTNDIYDPILLGNSTAQAAAAKAAKDFNNYLQTK